MSVGTQTFRSISSTGTERGRSAGLAGRRSLKETILGIPWAKESKGTRYYMERDDVFPATIAQACEVILNPFLFNMPDYAVNSSSQVCSIHV